MTKRLMRWRGLALRVGAAAWSAACLVAGMPAWANEGHVHPAATAAAASSPASSPTSASTHGHVSHGRFTDVSIYAPVGEARQFVLFLSGEAGWNEEAAMVARALADDGALVAGIHLPRLVARLEADGAACVLPDGDLENLSHYLQASRKLGDYLPPILVGQGEGAAWVYAMLAQAPAGTFAGGVSWGFQPELAMKKPLCKGEALSFAAARAGEREGPARMTPAARLRVPWIVLQEEGKGHDADDMARARAFVAEVAGAELSVLPEIDHGSAGPGAHAAQATQATHRPSEDAAASAPSSSAEHAAQRAWMARFKAGFAKAAVRAAPAMRPEGLPDLPITEVPAAEGQAQGDLFAVLLSGDGGWAGLDKDVAAALAASGIPVAGLDSLRYFWQARTPEGLARDVGRIMRHYAARWHKSRVLLIGYSQGADVLPFAVNRLPAELRGVVAHTVLLNIGEMASFEFHLSDWLVDAGDMPILPEVRRLAPASTLCLHGAKEDESPCAKAYAPYVKAVSLPGGHHFNGDYASLARTVLEHVGSR